jgi:hypothetical protein
MSSRIRSGRAALALTLGAASLILGPVAVGQAATAPGQIVSAVTGVEPPTPIAAYGGRLVWSQPDGNGRYELVQRIGDGPVQVLPIAPRGVPFDVDLGPTSSGGVYAVYSRCRVEAPWSGDQMPQYQLGRDCAIYKLDLMTNTETRYTVVNAPDASEYWPTYWKGVIAFARAYRSKPGDPVVYAKTISSSTPSLRLPGGPRGSGAATPLELETDGKRVAFAWRYEGNEEAPAYDLLVDTIGGGQILIDSTPGGGLSAPQIGWPSLENGRIYWLRSCLGDPGGCSMEHRFEDSNYTSKPRPLEATSPPYVQAEDRDQGITWAETDINTIFGCQTDPLTAPSCEIQALTPDYEPPA